MLYLARIIFEILCAPFTIVQQYMFIRKEAKSFETNPYKLNIYPLFLAPVAFLIRMKHVVLGQPLK